MLSALTVIAGGTCGTSISPLQERKSRLTSSFGIVIGRTGIIVDHGYGVQNVVAELRRQSVEDVIILQTHFHMDHIAGMSMNSFFFDRQLKSLGVWAPFFPKVWEPWDARIGFDRAFQEAFSEERWPVSPPYIMIHPPFDIEDPDNLPFGIRAFKLNHPGGSVAYRIPHPHGDVVIATDHEPDDSTDAGYAKFVSGATLLIADIQYRQSEYIGKVGIGGAPPISRQNWGHATPERLLATLQRCDAVPKNLWVTHHDPMRPQADMDQMFDETQVLFSGLCNVRFVNDGDTAIL